MGKWSPWKNSRNPRTVEEGFWLTSLLWRRKKLIAHLYLVWILEKEDDTGKLRFRNTITGKIRYDKPIGLTLEDFEEEAWENAFSNF